MGDSTAIEWSEELKVRFWSYMDRRGPDECWPWKAGLFVNGYGQFRAGRRKVKAHRCAYELEKGPLGGVLGCHTCDNPPCCNPAHIFAGTNLDNIRDRDSKGRTGRTGGLPRPGALNPAAKLTQDQVAHIRQRRAGGHTLMAIAIAFGVSQSQIRNIVTGASWR